jgi:hypothetical protein
MITGLSAASVTLQYWNIICVTPPGYNQPYEVFIGFSLNDRLGRLSTPILNYDESTGSGNTRSGSVYSTIGMPGRIHDDALYTLEMTFSKEIIQKELFSDQGEGILVFKYPF